MKILITCKTNTGFNIFSEAVMLDRSGAVLPCIDNLYHPNPGTDATGYDEIERPIDWLYMHNQTPIFPTLNEWVNIRVADILTDTLDIELDDLITDVMYADSYKPHSNTKAAIKAAYEQFIANPDTIIDWEGQDETECARRIAYYINQRFLRVRAGGKLNPEGSNAIYFRISSQGYDWHRVIVDFLWDICGSPDKMPRRIWIGHDAETNPPELTLFDGTADDLFENFDSKVFSAKRDERKAIYAGLDPRIQNKDRINFKVNKSFLMYKRLTSRRYTPYI